MDERAWQTLLARIRIGRCTPFIGAGACAGTLPLGRDVAQAWAAEWGYPLADTHDLPRVAQYVAVTNDSMLPKEIIAGELRARGSPPADDPHEPHRALAALGLPVYVTTNYDDFMVRALEAQGMRPHREVCRWNRYTMDYRDAAEPSVFDDPAFKPTPDDPVVYHLHGVWEQPESMVLTEDDYLDFVVNLTRYRDLLPVPIRGALAGSSLLFIGYAMEDATFKVLFKGLVGSLEASTRRLSIAVQLERDSVSEKQYLDEYFKDQDVVVYWGTATEFVRELQERLAAADGSG